MRMRWARGLLALIGTVLFLGSVVLLVLSISRSALFPTESAAAGSVDEELPACRWQLDGVNKGELPTDGKFNVKDINHIVMSENEDQHLRSR